ncbi:MAG: hypothetical protein IKK83_04710 [Clostridia bacterium]|nr:hypothetical protein [Clostridia bacterium]
MKRLIAFLIVTAAVFCVLSACGVEHPFVGEWRDEQSHNMGFVFNEDGTFHYVSEGRVMYELGTHEWEAREGKLYVDGAEYADYRLVEGKLTVWELAGGERVGEGVVYLKK